MGLNRRVPVALLAIALVGSACSNATTAVSEPSTPTTFAVPEDVAPSEDDAPTRAPSAIAYEQIDVAGAVTELDDPATAINGVMGLLDALGIGVYTADGTEILPGSQSGTDELWVLAEMLPGMAVSASRPGPTMEKYLSTLESQLETGLEPGQLAAVYAVTLESQPDSGMSQVIRALDIRLVPDERLTRFEAWLLLLPWLPSNGQAAPSAAPGTPLPAVAVASPAIRALVRCGPTKSGGKKPGYSMFDQYGKPIVGAAEGVVVERAIERLGDGWEAAGTAASNTSAAMDWLKKVAKPFTTLLDIAKAGQVAANFDVDVDTEPISTHEVHDTQGETKEKKRAQVTITVMFLGVTAEVKEDCKFAPLLGLPDPNTPIEGAQVKFMLDKQLANHGTVRRRGDQNHATASADENGQVTVWYEPNLENPDSAQDLSDAFLHKVQGSFTVSVNITAAMGQLFNPVAGWEFLADLLGLNEIEGSITVGWHDPAARVAIVEPLPPGWKGDQAIYLETCDGINWSGAVVARGTFKVEGGTLTQVSDSAISVTMAPGTSTGTSTILQETDITGTVDEATMETRKTQTGELTLSIDENGKATITMALDQGAADVTVRAPDGTGYQSVVLDPETYTWTTAVEPNQCDG